MSLADSSDVGPLTLDVEESLPAGDPAEPPRKRIRGIQPDYSSELGVTRGPFTMADTFLWAQQFLQTMGLLSVFCIGVDLEARLRATLGAGLQLITDYSGMGCPEEALRLILIAVGGGLLESGKVRVLRAGDLNAICRGVLLAHLGPLSPHCVFGDILSRAPKTMLTRLQSLAKACQKRADAAIVGGMGMKMAIDKYAMVFFKKASARIIKSVDAVDPSELKSLCHRHLRRCCSLADWCVEFSGLRGCVAG